MVDVMEKIYNKDDYINGLLDDAGNIAAWAVGIFPNTDSLQKMIDDLVASTDELRYDRLLKSIYTQEYTASNGDTVGMAERELLGIRQIQDMLSYLNTFLAFAKTEATTIVGAVNVKEFNEVYINKYALPYAEASKKYLGTLKELANIDQNKHDDILIDAAMCFALIGQYECLNMDGFYGDFSYHKFLEDYTLGSDIINTCRQLERC